MLLIGLLARKTSCVEVGYYCIECLFIMIAWKLVRKACATLETRINFWFQTTGLVSTLELCATGTS